MVADLKWAHRWRLELAVEIAQLDGGTRRVLQTAPEGTVDVTSQVVSTYRQRFEQLEAFIDATGTRVPHMGLDRLERE